MKKLTQLGTVEPCLQEGLHPLLELFLLLTFIVGYISSGQNNVTMPWELNGGCTGLILSASAIQIILHVILHKKEFHARAAHRFYWFLFSHQRIKSGDRVQPVIKL